MEPDSLRNNLYRDSTKILWQPMVHYRRHKTRDLPHF